MTWGGGGEQAPSHVANHRSVFDKYSSVIGYRDILRYLGLADLQRRQQDLQDLPWEYLLLAILTPHLLI